MNVKSVIRLLSFILLFIAIIMTVPLALAVMYDESVAFSSFLKTIIFMTATSLLGVFATNWGNREIKIGPKESYLFVTLAWVLFSLFGALPLFFSSVFPSYAACYFEIMSGFTTTGATALNNIEAVDKSLLFWRNMTNWLGGMGVVVLFVAILPAFGVKGTALVGAESVGPTKDKLTPHIRHTALALWSIYFFLSLLETLLLMVFGLNLYNAVTVTFGTMGAAGFTPTNLSIASFNSPAIEWICIIFMFLSGANFALYFKAIMGQVKKALKDGELRIYTAIVLVSSLFIALNLFFSAGMKAIDAIRHSLFQVVSFTTTTGFSSTQYQNWPIFSQMILFVLSFVGGCAGSAGGGPKVIRVATIFKLGKSSIRKRLHPTSVSKIRIGDDTLSQDTVSGISGFIGMYLVTFAIASIVISLTGKDLITVLSSCILTLGNIGIGLGGIGMDFSFSIYPDWALWVFSFLMLVGRLELFTVYALFTKDFWRS